MKTVNPRLDSVLMVLKAHLLAEYYIDQLISLEIRRGDIILNNSFNFYQKLIVIKSLDLMENYLWDSIEALNRLRNRCAHDMDYKISETDIDKLGFPQGREYAKEKERFVLDKKGLLHHTLIGVIAPLDGLLRHVIKHHGHNQSEDSKIKNIS